MYTLEDFKKRNVKDQASLTEALAWASMKYYIENDPPMSDFEFDMEFKQLQALEKASGIIIEGSPTQHVGSDIQGSFEKRKHIIPMQSIENVYSDDELQEWLSQTTRQLQQAFPDEKVSYTYEPKYDGLSISLIYTDGMLTDAVTRGNQLEGESVIANVRTIRNVPQRLSFPSSEPSSSDEPNLFSEFEAEQAIALPHIFEVRGEVLMPQGAFDRLNKEKEAHGEKPFANKRNAASGSLKQLDPKVTAKRGLIVNAYAAYSTDETWQAEHLSSQEATLNLLDTLGFSHYQESQAFENISQLTEAINRFNDIRNSRTLPYDCDGVVVKVNQRKHQEYLGLNTTFPNWCKARKFPQEAQSTLVRGVTFQVGMTGHITPVAELDPTAISGSIVSRATLNNENYIRQLGIFVGAYVFVQKAGEVIPQVTSLDNERNSAEPNLLHEEIKFPETCPCCQTPLIKKGEYWICPNRHCKQQAIQRLEYWCGKDCANIKGLGPSVLEDLFDKLNIASVNDLYKVLVTDETNFEPDVFLSSYRAFLRYHLGEGYAEKSITQMLDGVRQSISTLTLDRIIGGLGIDGIGKITGKLLAQHFSSLDALRHATYEELIAIDQIGDIMARNIMEADLSDYSCLWEGILPFNTTFAAAEKLGNALDGITIIFTGTSSRFKRDEIKDFFTRHGAKYVGSVSGKVNYVVIGDAPGQNKIDKARQLGIEIITEHDFYEKFGL
ncbi:MAG: NAD-dependent DNA ligase LigA [Bacteroidales bacterium]|nr:NAD-dependent DNA ligase LigA [Bacteroidales bacterium]